MARDNVRVPREAPTQRRSLHLGSGFSDRIQLATLDAASQKTIPYNARPSPRYGSDLNNLFPTSGKFRHCRIIGGTFRKSCGGYNLKLVRISVGHHWREEVLTLPNC